MDRFVENEMLNTTRYFEIFLNSLRQEDLKFAIECREKLKEEVKELLELQHTISIMKIEEIQKNGLKTAMNIGCDFFVDAFVKNVSKILINIGNDIYIEYHLDEALIFLDNKIKLLEHEIEYMSSKIAEIEALIDMYNTSSTLLGVNTLPLDTSDILNDILLKSSIVSSVNKKITSYEIAQDTLSKIIKT